MGTEKIEHAANLDTGRIASPAKDDFDANRHPSSRRSRSRAPKRRVRSRRASRPAPKRDGAILQLRRT